MQSRAEAATLAAAQRDPAWAVLRTIPFFAPVRVGAAVRPCGHGRQGARRMGFEIAATNATTAPFLAR